MKRSRFARMLLGSINVYQHVMQHRPSPCRYVPSCSEYAREAIEVHGPARGSWLAVRRLSRCHPLGGRGFDPVPAPAGGPVAHESREHAC